MGILSVQEIWDQSLTGDRDQRGQRRRPRAFRVRTTSLADGEVIVLSAVDPLTGLTIPNIFDPYVDANGHTDPQAICASAQPHLQRDPREWLVICTYSNFVEGSAEMAAQGYIQPNPLLRPAIPHWGREEARRVANYDLGYVDLHDPTQNLDARAVNNSTGQKFSPANEIEDPRSTLALTWNIPAPLLSLSDGGTSMTALGILLQYQNTLNLDTFLTCLPSTVKCKTIDPGETRFEEGIYFQPVTAHFAFRFDTIELTDDAGGTQTIVGWEIDEYVPDIGWYVLDTTTGKPKKYVDPTGLNPGGPYPLNGAGQVLVNPGGGAPQQFYFLHYYFSKRGFFADLMAGVVLV